MFNFSSVFLILEEHCQAAFVIAVLSARLLKCFGVLRFCCCALQITKIQAFIIKCLWFQEFYEPQVCVHVFMCTHMFCFLFFLRQSLPVYPELVLNSTSLLVLQDFIILPPLLKFKNIYTWAIFFLIMRDSRDREDEVSKRSVTLRENLWAFWPFGKTTQILRFS